MELTIDEIHAKKLLKEALLELMNERQDLFFEIVTEALEEAGLVAAIREGRKNRFVDEDEITAILEG
ncbi:MAG: hypothetical protein H6657_17625 [Ardenticatenaceae bacterium]|nr:hypothetical protein [Anaerolineales bacterium]MCB8979237.1 hypothetical protein [Ardenticatenaceae bacterium]